MNRMLVAVAAAAWTLALSGCDVEQTEEGEMPDVEAEGGNLPEYDIDSPDVDVGTEERTITVPDVDVEPAGEDEEVPVEARDPEDPPDDR